MVSMTQLDKIIFEKKMQSSEELLDIIYAPEYQCKNIDSILKDLSDAYKSLDRALADDDPENKDEYINSATSDLYTLDYDIENLREAIDQVREWGQAWKDLAKQLLDEKENLKEYLGFEEE